MRKVNIVQVGGFASTNVGNDFFTKSIHHVLTRANPEYSVVTTQNLPGYYWKENGTNPKNSFNYLERIETDYLVITGPLFDVNFPKIWKETLSTIKRNGTRLLILSAGSQKYDSNERKTVRAFLKTIEPYAIVSRDTPTYEAYKDLAEYSYDGIDFSFFIDDIFKPYKLAIEDYIILNFDTMPEPKFTIGSKYENRFTFLGEERSYKTKTKNKLTKELSKNFPKTFRYHNKVFGRYTIIRPQNYVNPGTRKALFAAPNSFVSELAFDYLNLFANAQGVLSSRVHSCLASLVFGKEVMLFSKTLRGQLFDRIQLSEIRERPVTLNMEYIADEKGKMFEFIKAII